MNGLLVLSPSAAAGKTVWVVGLARAMRLLGIKVCAFKPIAEDSVGLDIDGGTVANSALHLMAAAGHRPSGTYNPVLLRPLDEHRFEVLLLGKRIGEVSRLARDTPVMDDLGTARVEQIRESILACLQSASRSCDVVVVEGSGGACDLSLQGSVDMANVDMARYCKASVMVARASHGGALPGVAGCLSLLPREIKSGVIGFALNDVRVRFEETCQAGIKLAVSHDVSFLGATPWIPWFEGRPRFEAFSDGSDEDHRILAQAVRENVDLKSILIPLGFGHVF